MNGHRRMLLQAGYMTRKQIDNGMSRDEAIQWSVNIMRAVPGGLNEHKAADYLQTGMAIAALAWAEHAFATITLSHRLAASLMMTSLPLEYLEEIVPPWDAFCVDIPAGLLPEASFLLCVKLEDKWQSLVCGERAAMFTPIVPSFSALLMAEEETACDVDEPLRDLRLVTYPRRLVIARLLAGICLEIMTSGTSNPKVSRGTQVKEKRGEPRPYIYQLSREVKLDLRSVVTDFVSGDYKRVISVQSLIRGHVKRQSCGPHNSLRKWIHIEPYWRGPENAPIAVRAHRVDA